MTDHLRTIAVTVEESEHGCFHWVLIESFDDPTHFTALIGSADVFPTWLEALDGGVATLKSLVFDRANGPRQDGEVKGRGAVGRRVRRRLGWDAALDDDSD